MVSTVIAAMRRCSTTASLLDVPDFEWVCILSFPEWLLLHKGELFGIEGIAYETSFNKPFHSYIAFKKNPRRHSFEKLRCEICD